VGSVGQSLLLALAVIFPMIVSWAPLQLTAAQEGDESGPRKTINVELILDVSGSMAQVIDTGETRMDAAKRVLLDVIAAIPEQPGINVGLRVYGHKGNNTEAGKVESCESSELVVPLKGVDKDRLGQEVEALQPTGWTPIAESLKRADKDFTENGKDVINAIVLITDGLETCGGDPARVAERLHGYKRSIATSVIGFALTGEEQEILASIAERGGGKLLGASNATELSSALFSILEELDVVVGVGYVGGNAFGLVPAGEAGELSVVAYGPLNENATRLPFVVRNNTAEDVVGLKIAVTVRDTAGGLLGAEDALDVKPYFVRAGGLAIGYAFFSPGTTFPADAVYTFDVSPTPTKDARFSSRSDLDVVEAALFENRIAGTVMNGFDEPVKGPLSFSAACFDEAGNLRSVESGFSDTGDLAPRDTQSFQVDLSSLTYNGSLCPAFLVTGQGHGPSRLPASAQPGPGAAASGSANSTATSSAGEVEPTAEPTDEKGDDFVLSGLEEAALRNFDAAGSNEGLLSLSTVVLKFSSEDVADAGLEAVADRFFALHGQSDGQLTISEPRPVSAPKLGDRRVAYSWTATDAPTGLEFTFGMIVVRKGDIVYQMTAASRGTNPLTDLADVGRTIITDEPRQPASGGLQTGGVWDLLPTLDEIPFGLVVELEKVPEDYGPVPATESAAAPVRMMA